MSGPLEKGGAAFGDAATPEPTERREDNPGVPGAQPSGEDVSSTERRKLYAYKLARLAMCGTLSPWQRRFVREMSRSGKKISPGQAALLERIADTHLPGSGGTP